MITQKQLTDLTKEHDSLPLECDGLTRVLHLVLLNAGVSYRPMMGWIKIPTGFIPHYWIEAKTSDGHMIVDYRRRVWLGADANHGVFPVDGEVEGKIALLEPAGCYALAALHGLAHLLPKAVA